MKITTVNSSNSPEKMESPPSTFTIREVIFIRFSQVNFSPHHFLDGFSDGFTTDYQKFALDYKNIFRVLAVNCGSYPDICDKEKIEETPVLRVYPQIPIPSFDIEGEITTKRLARACARFI
jgi:hypothetical protein